MDLSKSYEFFDPAKSPEVHVIGCGAIGSTIAVQLARLGVTNIHLWDMDIVESTNIANQQFFDEHVGVEKTSALGNIMRMINPVGLKGNNSLVMHDKYTNEQLKGIVFIAVDKIQVRKDIITNNRYNFNVKGFIDVRMGLTDAQLYSAYNMSQLSVDNLLKSMDFTQEEADKATPVSACGTTLSVIPTVQIISAYAVANYINFSLTDQPTYKMINLDAFNGASFIFNF